MRWANPARACSRALRSVERQTGLEDRRIEIVVSDHSKNDSVFSIAQEFSQSSGLILRYIRNEEMRGSSSANVNRAFRESRQPIVKILFQDDFFSRNDALARIVQAFDEPSVTWVACGATHSRDGESFENPLVPRFHRWIHLGRNTMSSPSVIAVRRSHWLGFDPNLLWLMDVDFYKRIFLRHGLPTIIPDILVVNGQGSHQVTHTRVSKFRKRAEVVYVFAKHSLQIFRRVKP